MNFNLLNQLVNDSKLGKIKIAERANVSRTTLDNALNGADIRISTLENVSKVLEVSPSIFFVNEGTTNVAIADQSSIAAINSTISTTNQSSNILNERIKFLEQILQERERQIQDKERLIQILMNK